MLQEACDALIDNGRRGRAIAGTGNHRLKSLSDMLKGKQGRFRQNLLGKRVDYSGRSVIVVGPELKLHQCGLPKKMALELFKPFVMRQLVEKGFAHNIKSAKRIVERVRPEVWDVLEEVIKDHPVLLNRAPTLHRLGIQAFMPVLVEGSAIQIHPLVCTAFNADFDGDQMAVHVPLSTAAQEEARTMMLSTANLLSPADGSPVVAPTQDMVLGCYYLTMDADRRQGQGASAPSPPRTRRSWPTSSARRPGDAPRGHRRRGQDLGPRDRDPAPGAPPDDDRPGDLQPDPARQAPVPRQVMRRADLKALVDVCYRQLGSDETAHLVDGIKSVGFEFATRGGMTIGLFDIEIPKDKAARLAAADESVAAIDKQFQRGLITEDERYEQVVGVWQDTTARMSDEMMKSLDPTGPVTMMTASGARGNKGNIGQLGAMRGLMADPSGRIIDVPVRSNFREGMTVLEYFISTHGARKGLADTALRTADSGYLTRRLVDVAQDVITREEDCGTEEGSWIIRSESSEEKDGFLKRLVGRLAAAPAAGPERQAQEGRGAQLLVERNEIITEEIAARIDEAGVDEVLVRSPLTCEARYGVCRACYGRNLATGEMVGSGEAVGIIAAQSIGEPGTQLTMRTFHTGGVAGLDITAGLPRVEELFEARIPKGKAEISHIDGIVEIIRGDGPTKVKVISTEVYDTVARVTAQGARCSPRPATWSRPARCWPAPRSTAPPSRWPSPVKGFLVKDKRGLVVRAEDVVEREYVIPHNAKLLVENGQEIRAGDRHHRWTDQPAGVPRHPGQGRRPALPREGSPEGLPEPGRHDQRQAHRDHRPPDAPQGPHRPAGRRRPAADRARRPPRVRGAQQPRPRRGRRAGHGPDRAAGRDQGLAQHLELPRRGVLPGDHPGAHRGRHQRRQGPPDRPQGERHHRQAHPRRDGRAGERGSRARSASAGRPSRPSPARRSKTSASEYNPFLEDGETRAPDDEADRPRPGGHHRRRLRRRRRLRQPVPVGPTTTRRATRTPTTAAGASVAAAARRPGRPPPRS